MARIILENVGPFERKTIELKEGCLNIIGMPNASGKSTILKAIALALSYPYTSEFTRRAAARLGLWAEDPPQPMLRVGSNKGHLELEINGLRSVCEITYDDIFRKEGIGDDRSLFTCFASTESEFMREIAEGNPDLSQVVSALSLIDYYKRARIVAEEILNNIKYIHEKAKGALESKNELLTKKRNIEEELEQIKKRIEELSARRDSLIKSRDPKLWERLSTLRGELKGINGKIRKKEEDLEEVYKKLRREELEKLMKDKEKLENKLKEIQEEIEKLPFSGDREEIRKRMDVIDKEVTRLGTEYSKWDLMKRLLDEATKVIKGGVEGCPVCGSPTVNPTYIERKLSEVTSKLQKLEREIRNLHNEKDKLVKALKSLGELKNKEDSISSELNYLKKLIKEIEDNAARYKPVIESCKIDLEELKRKREDVLNEIKALEMSTKDISDELGKVSRGLDELRGKQGVLEEKLNEIKRELGSLEEHLEIMGIKVPAEKAVEICPRLIKSLEQLIEHLTDKIERQKADFAKRFNDAISHLLRDLQFELDAMIDPNTLELIVKREGKIQRLTSLSLSERAALALLIQIALKEAFLPDVPIFLVDEVILGFDRSRVERIINYLLEMAKNKGMTIVLTRLSDKEEVRVITDASSNFSLLP
ncbi:MAG: hypothetical protein DSO07_06885 [Thermoproteota archaeon]|uniref:Rad50/SbcC-type AAA domain-containing protein n=1 Tax=Candidatus Methanodesulfokora washburnensis TaxID=2478471 RepID=A0A3R9PK74_9CREN|nr:archaea-specific SMC-related protein [Candidatus Methanodesulfokores washburnensis]RSN78710.1 hypothetical protein D6D85_00625 [Candidatus Methanodesulfokores washburnensis]TDA41004.1 MAG: hypothetical protein DSO07_06885 [Candidatus Korarchaeota archaeon]